MDPLQQLWDLYEMNVLDKPALQPDPEPSAMGTPNKGQFQHPVIQQRNQVDMMRTNGMSDTDAHQAVHGEIDLADADSKAKMAATLSRIQTDNEKRGIQVDKDADFKSLLARDKEAENMGVVTPSDLKTPQASEIPPELEQQQEDWYNFDVAYLQQYGRA